MSNTDDLSSRYLDPHFKQGNSASEHAIRRKTITKNILCVDLGNKQCFVSTYVLTYCTENNDFLNCFC